MWFSFCLMMPVMVRVLVDETWALVDVGIRMRSVRRRTMIRVVFLFFIFIPPLVKFFVGFVILL